MTLPGAPVQRRISLTTQRNNPPSLSIGSLAVRVVEEDASQLLTRIDQGRVQVAPFILMQNSFRPLRMWMCESESSGRRTYRPPQSSGGQGIDPADLDEILEGLDPNDPLAGLPEEDADTGGEDGSGLRLGNLGTFVYSTQAENKPSIHDVQTALRGTNVIFQLIPLAVNHGDCWIQDQLQFGYCHGPSGWMHVAVHLPRQQSNAAASQPGANLSGFTTSHLPSTRIGVFDDFWQRHLVLADTQGNPVNVAYERSFPLLRLMLSIVAGFNYAREQIREYSSGSPLRQMPDAWSTARRELDDIVNDARRIVTSAKDQSTARDFRQLANEVLVSLDERLQMADTRAMISGQYFILRVDDSAFGGSANTAFRVSATSVDDLYSKLRQLHSSQNYGGNIEVGPPTGQANFGKLVIGNTTDPVSQETLMDNELVAFLEAQHVQPLVELDTNWLEVGHVDEMVTFVTKADGNHAVLRASSGLAMDILHAASDRYLAGLVPQQGLDVPHDHRLPYDGIRPQLGRDMKHGRSPVSHMLRGREWLHHHPGNALDIHLPPRIYRRLAVSNARLHLSRHNVPLRFGAGADRRYPSNISVWEFLYYEYGAFGNEPELYTSDDVPHHRIPSNLSAPSTRSTNYYIENEFLLTAEGVLQNEFAGVDIFCLPVLFDAMYLGRSQAREHIHWTSAFTPNLVNMQVIGDRLLIPRPYGPRMKADDALHVVRRVATDAVRRKLTSNLITRRKLNKLEIWLEPPISIARLAQWFHDASAFATNQADFRRAILSVNQRHFDQRGELKSGWRKITIPENTVDLFELYSEAVVSLLGLKIHWVDSWYYHIRLGEIHCGSNVLRQPDLSSRRAWWRNFS